MSLRQDLQKTSNKRRHREALVRLAISIGVFCILTAIVIFLFYIPSLRITNVIVAGLASADEKDLRAEVLGAISSRRYLILPKDHLIFFPKDEITELLKNKYRVKQFELEKDFPSGLKISVTERETWAIWCLAESNKCLLLDKEGVAFEKAPGVSGSAVLKIIDARDEDFLGRNILPPAAFGKISYMIENVPKKTAEEIKIVNIKSSGDTYLLYLKSGSYLLIDDETDAPRSIENLTLAFESEIKEKGKLEYIDLRFPDKVFYKYRD